MTLACPVSETPEPSASCAERTRKVLHVINGEHYSGAERVQDLLALRLGEFGYQTGFALLKPGKFAENRRATGAPLWNTPMKRRWDLRAADRLAKVIREGAFELVHTHTPRAALLGMLACRQTRTPLVHHVHSPTLADSTHRWRNWLNARIEKACLRRAAAVIAVSDSLGKYAETQQLGRGKVWVVPNGVPVLGPLSERSTPSGTWTLGMAALFRPRKGLEVLLEALASLRAQGQQVRLLAIGGFETAEYEQSIHALAARLQVQDFIEWTGFTSDVNQALARLDLFVLPSLFGEGLPMVVLEAMAAGIPLVATEVEGVPQAIRHGQDGLLARPGDATSLAATIRQFLTGQADWQQLRRSAHQRQGAVFSDRAMAEQVASIYDGVLGP